MDSGPFGLCDPYLKLRMAGTEHTTQVIKGSLSPSWNEIFNFSWEEAVERAREEDATETSAAVSSQWAKVRGVVAKRKNDKNRDMLLVECYDYDMVGTHGFIGGAQISTKTLNLTSGTSKWYKLSHPEKPESRAEVFLSLYPHEKGEAGSVVREMRELEAKAAAKADRSKMQAAEAAQDLTWARFYVQAWFWCSASLFFWFLIGMSWYMHYHEWPFWTAVHIQSTSALSGKWSLNRALTALQPHCMYVQP